MDNKHKYEHEASLMTDNELRHILINRNMYNGWLITSARKELEKRGVEFTSNEIKEIELQKKKRIEFAKYSSEKKDELKWFLYEDYKLKQIAVEFKNSNFHKRMRNEILILSGVVILFVTPYIWNVGINNNTLNLIITIFAFYLIFGSLNALFQNRYCLIGLNADKNGFKLRYNKYNREMSFESDWKLIKIKRSRTLNKNPQTILIIKENNRTVIRLYASVNKEIDNGKMDKLIESLKILKNASHQN